MYERLFGLLDGTDLESDAANKDAWKERENLAYSILCNSVERKRLGSLLDCKTSSEIWTTLLSTYEQKTNENLHELQKKFVQAVMSPESLLLILLPALISSSASWLLLVIKRLTTIL